jgi:Ni/Co efflux regulator RcnB
MTTTIMAAALAVTMLAAPTAYAQSSKGIPTISAQERQAQQTWWAARAQRRAEQRMAACMALPECSDGRNMPAAHSNKD